MRNPIKAPAREPINRPDTYERFPKSCQFLDCEQQPTHTFEPSVKTAQILRFHGLCGHKNILKLDAEVSDGAVHLRVAQQQLDCTKVARLSLDLRNLGSLHRMRVVRARPQANRGHPVTDNPRILAGRDLKAFVKPAGSEVFGSQQQEVLHSPFERGTGACRDFEAGRFLRLASRNRCALLELVGRHDIYNFHFDQIAAAQLAVDGEIKEREVSTVLGQLKPNPDLQDVFGFERSLLTDDTALVRGAAKRASGRQVRCFLD